MITMSKRSQKLRDPPQLNGGIAPTWNEWLYAIRYKLNVNGDHWEDEYGKVGYTLTRLVGKALKYTLRRRLKGTINPYRTVDNVLEYLALIYENSLATLPAIQSKSEAIQLVQSASQREARN